nr:InlB B-repeat-containing protein [Tissierella carlieri]
MAAKDYKVNIKARPNRGYEFDRWEFSDKRYEADKKNIIDVNSSEITINKMNAMTLLGFQVNRLKVTAHFKEKEGEEPINDEYITDVKVQSQNWFKDFRIEDDKLIIKPDKSIYGYFVNGLHANNVANAKLVIDTKGIEKIKVSNPYTDTENGIVGKEIVATSEEWAQGIKFSEFGIVENGENKIGFFKDHPVEFTFFPKDGNEFKLIWDMQRDSKDHILYIASDGVIRKSEVNDKEISLKINNDMYKMINDFNIESLELHNEKSLIISTLEVKSIKVDNSKFAKGGYRGITTGEISSEDWQKGVKFSVFGAEKDGQKIIAIDNENPPLLTFKTMNDEEFIFELKIDQFIPALEFTARGGNLLLGQIDKEAKIEVKDTKGEEIKEKFLYLVPGEEYNIIAVDGTRSKFKEWTSELKPIDENFEIHFGDKSNRELKISATDDFIFELQKTNKDVVKLNANYEVYVSVEVELKEEEKKEGFSNESKVYKNNLNIMEYSIETEEYEEKLNLLKNSVKTEYTHKLEANMGEGYIILKDKDGNIKEKLSPSLNNDIVWGYGGLIGEYFDTLELVAIPKVGYEFVKWQIITPAMNIEDEWDMPINYFDPNSGVSAEAKSPYIRTKLENMINKSEGHRNRFSARAIFKSIDDSNAREIEEIADIYREYIKGYTDKGDVLLKSVEAKYKDNGEKVIIPVEWENPNIDNLPIGRNIITGKLKDPRFTDKEAKLYLTVKEIVGFGEPEQRMEVINSNWFGEGQRHKLPERSKVNLNDGEQESTLELDIKWDEEDLNSEETHKINGKDIIYYKHGRFTAVGRVKGYDGELKYVLEVIQGNEVVFWVDDNFKKSKNDYIYERFSSIPIKKGESIPEPEIPTRPGYVSIGWYKDATWSNPLNPDAGIKFDFANPLGEAEMENSKFSLYNKWRKVIKCTINFDTNGGNHISSIEVEEGEKLTKPTEPIRNGYRFLGWYEDKGLTQEFNFATLIMQDLILYAKWEEEDPTPGTLEIGSVELIKDSQVVSTGVKKGNTFTLMLPENYSEKVDVGHILKIIGTEGSYLAQDNGHGDLIENWAAGNISNSIVVGETKKFTLTKDGKSEVYYVEIKTSAEVEEKHTIIFNTNGGNNIPFQEVEEGNKATRPSNPTRNGYRFIGWYMDSNLTQEFNFNTSITEDMTLYAKWEKAEEPTTELPRIIRFSLLGYEGSIDDRNERITISLPYNIELRNLVPSITISEGVTISPNKDVAQDFNRTVYYTVYGANNTQKTYRVVINMPTEREESRYWDDYYENYKKERDDYYKKRGEISWWELAKEAKEKRAEEELKIQAERDEKLILKERVKILNDVGKIGSRARNSRSSLMINDRFNHIEIMPTVADFKPGFSNIITIPKDVLTVLSNGEYEFIKYSTGVVNIEIYPFMETASGLKLNLCDVSKDIRDKWNKVKGNGYIFQVESDSTKGGFSYELNLEKQYPAEKLRFVKYNYMKGNFEDVPPEKWYVFGGKLRCDKVSAGIYGIIYKD